MFDGAARAGDRWFTVLGRRNKMGRPRLGLAISIKAAGNAVARNRVKRAAREAFRLMQDELGNIDIVVMARSGIHEKKGNEMRASLTSLFRSVDKKCAGS